MKITKSQLQRIIKEELQQVMDESTSWPHPHGGQGTTGAEGGVVGDPGHDLPVQWPEGPIAPIGGSTAEDEFYGQPGQNVSPEQKANIAHTLTPEYEEGFLARTVGQADRYLSRMNPRTHAPYTAAESEKTVSTAPHNLARFQQQNIDRLAGAVPRGMSVPIGQPTTGRGAAEDPFVTPGPRKGMRESLINEITEAVLAKLTRK